MRWRSFGRFPWRFRLLRTRLAVLYAGLFAVTMVGVSLALYAAVERNASGQVRSELVASGTVFDRLWNQRSAQLEDAAGLLAHDFGFRAAVATGDRRTVATALQNLRARLRVDMAFTIDPAGRVGGIDDPTTRSQAAALWPALDAGQMRGVANLGGRARQIIAAPVLTPVLSGWVVFAADLGSREMRGLEGLSAIPLYAGVYQRRTDGHWIEATDKGAVADDATSKFIDAALRGGGPSELQARGQASIAVAKSLVAMEGAPHAALLLRYPVSRALAPYRPLQAAIAVIGFIGLLSMLLATMRMARSITRPLSVLDAAAARLAAGGIVDVAVDGNDELARLATSFNRMAAEIAEREKRITRLAFHDVLTELPNRALFHEHLGFQLRSGERRGAGLALLCLDLDDFKSINDTLGHPIGDELLRLLGVRLTEVATGGFVARIGGDEFVVVHPLGDDRLAPDQLARLILEAVARPMRIDGHDIVAGASIGIALSPTDGDDVETLMRNADLALYRAKEGGRRTWCFFEEQLNERAQARRVIENDLRRTLATGGFELHFQPLFDLANDRIGAFEALLRWNHPERGAISPVEFIPIAEDTGLIVPLGAWVMREACRQAATWPDHIRVAVNVSSVQFQRPGLSEVIVGALASSGLAANRLEIEITESIFLEGCEDTLTTLHGLRSLGVRIALDDFGTGYSSLSYLQRFPFDKLKIDRSFIKDLLTRPGASAIVRAITDLARALGMETTAEGVEETGQLSELRAHGCSSIQGYLFSRPIPADRVSAMLAKNERSSAAIAA